MRLNRCLASLLLLFLTGCFGPGLAGEWDGGLDCGDGTISLAADIEKDRKDSYEGELTAESDIMLIDEDGSMWRLILDLELDLTVETDGRGEQELDYEALLYSYSCQLYLEGNLVSSDCDEMGVNFDGGRFDLGTFTWDGKDTIDIEDDDCSGSLER